MDAVASRSAIYVMDMSYSRNICSKVDGADWMIYCTSKKWVVFKSSFYKLCSKAGSYCRELLGLLTVHLLILAVEKFYGLKGGLGGLIACDTLGGLNKSRERQRKTPPSAKHADILRSLWQVHAGISGMLSYKLYGHKDKWKTWAQMTLLERLNSKCDSLAKAAVSRRILECPAEVDVARQLLPLETVAIHQDSRKVSRECGSDIHFHNGKSEARKYIT